MKHKVGDRFLVKITIVNEGSKYPYILGNEILVTEEQMDKIFQQADMTAEEAWEIARRIACDHENRGLSPEELADIFGERCFDAVMLDHTPQQAKAKIEAWEAARKIEVGDVVLFDAIQGVVVRLDKSGEESTSAYILWKDGSCCKTNLYGLQKTDQHIDIRGLLDRIGGAE